MDYLREEARQMIIQERGDASKFLGPDMLLDPDSLALEVNLDHRWREYPETVKTIETGKAPRTGSRPTTIALYIFSQLREDPHFAQIMTQIDPASSRIARHVHTQAFIQDMAYQKGRTGPYRPFMKE